MKSNKTRLECQNKIQKNKKKEIVVGLLNKNNQKKTLICLI